MLKWQWQNNHYNSKRMILICYIVCCILAAWYTQKPWILLYAIIPLGFQIYCACCSQKPQNEFVECRNEELRIDSQIEEWRSLGGPYYLHSDAYLIHLLHKIQPCVVRTKLVDLCNVMMRQKEEPDVEVNTTLQMKDRYIELVDLLGNTLDNNVSSQIRERMYRHMAQYLI